ncbi:toxin-antitoxin system YwqK family antitoxin [Saccharicrinis sp. 156]|uniref:toxin-antitoxin system YwqK family antitoxin n=1 Tax=Saccharicrinis sp. 156 TaxID=3417574 RepID=UPI003D32C930
MIRNTIVAAFLLIINVQIKGQETILKKREFGGIYEEYYVLKKDKKVKSGSYVKYAQNIFGHIIIFEKGYYSNNQKEGYWKKFGNNQLQEVRSYSKGMLNGDYYYYYIDTSGVKTSNQFIDYKGTKNDSLIFTMNDEQLLIREHGKYKNDRRSGIWNFYHANGDVYYTYDFSNDSLIFNDNVSLIENRELPCYKGGGKNGLLMELFPYLYSNMSNDSVNFNCSFLISSNGKLESLTVNSSLNSKKYNKRIPKMVKLRYDWLCNKNQEGCSNYEAVISIVKGEEHITTNIELKNN